MEMRDLKVNGQMWTIYGERSRPWGELNQNTVLIQVFVSHIRKFENSTLAIPGRTFLNFVEHFCLVQDPSIKIAVTSHNIIINFSIKWKRKCKLRLSYVVNLCVVSNIVRFIEVFFGSF